MNEMRQVGSRSDWFAGFVLGLACGLCILVAGLIGITVLLAALLLVAWKGPRSLALTGLVTGIGLVWAALLLRVWLTCDVLPQPPGTTCESGGFGLWHVASITILLAGVVASALAVRRGRRRP